jgi:hypothetical protein
MRKKMITLFHGIGHWLHGLGRRRNASTIAGRDLARDLALPPEIVSQILDQAAADLRKLEPDNGDAVPIISKAVRELASHGFHAQPLDDAALTRYLKQVQEPHLTILDHYRAGMKHTEIAALLHMDKQAVLRSLAKTYADLRMKMMGDDRELQSTDPGATHKSLPTSARARH